VSAYLVIRLGSDVENVSWLRLDTEAGASPITRGPLSQAAQQSIGARIVVLVPSRDVLITEINMPTQNRQRIKKAVPFALEDRLVENVDDMHFALGERTKDELLPVCVVGRDQMEKWQSKLRQAALFPEYLIPDVYALPSSEDTWTILQEEDDTLVRVNGRTGFAVDFENTDILLPIALKQQEKEPPTRMVMWHDAQTAFDTTTFIDTVEELEIEEPVTENGLMGILKEQGTIDLKKAINLLQGDYSKRERIGKWLRPWKTAGILAAVWFVLHWSVMMYENISLQGQYDELRQQVVDIYKQAFPQAKKIPNPKQQMKQKLSELRGGGGGNEFQSMLIQSGEVIRKTGGVVLKSIRYRTGVMDVELTVPSLQVLDQLKQQIIDAGDLQVEIQSAQSRDSTVDGRLHIKRK